MKLHNCIDIAEKVQLFKMDDRTNFYLASEVDEQIIHMNARIAELEKALREAIEWNWLDEDCGPDWEIKREVARLLGLDANCL